MSQQNPFPLSSEKADAAPSAQRKRPWAAVLMALILAGAAVWFWMGKDPAKREAVPAAAREAAPVTRMPLPENAAPATAQSQVSSQTAGTAADQTTDRIGSQDSGQIVDQATDQAADQAADQTTDQAASQTGSRIADQSTDQTGSQGAGGALSVPAAPAPGEAEGQTTRGLVVTEPQPPQEPGLSGRKDDAVVRPAFIDDLARWMVGNYIPASRRGGRGGIGIGIQSINARYGMGMKGLVFIGDDLPAGRAEALRYIYTPGMLDALYRMYIDRFMLAMAEAAAAPRKNGKMLDQEQVAEMYRLYAGRLRSLSGAMQAATTLEDLRARVLRIREASQKTVAANARYMDEVSKFDQAREGSNQALIDKARAAMEAASDAYRTIAQERDQLRDALIGAIRSNPGARGFDDDNLLYVALWIDRRLQQSPQAREASLQGAALFLDLAQRCERASGARP